MIDLNNKKSRKFIAIIKNTIEDLKQNVECNVEVLEGLKDIVKNKRLTLLNVEVIYQIIESRKSQLDFIKKFQDKYSFDLVNDEHRYIEKFISQYFDSSGLYFEEIEGGRRLLGFLTFKNINNTDNRKVG